MKDKLLHLWTHYTQITLGMLEFFAGMAEYIDAQTLHIVGDFFGPKWGPIVSKGVQCMAGLTIAARGVKARQAAKADGR